jgi:hypothetical protein
MCDAASLRVLSSKVAFASPQRLSALRASFNRTVGCLVKCCSPSDSSRRPAMLHSQKSRMQRTNINSHSSAHVLIKKSFAALKPCEQHRIVLLQANVQLEDQMRVLAILLGVGTAVGIAAGVSPAPAASSIQLAQAQDSGAPSGAGAGASQRGSAGNREGGNREGGAAATGGSQERGAATRPSGDPSATTRSETKRTSRTTVRERAGGTRVSVHGSTRRVVGVRAAAGDDAVVIRRKRARGYVYSEPSTTVIRKKRYVHYREPSSTVVIKKRRPAVAVEGVSTRTTVRSQTSTTVRGAGTTRESVGAGTSVRERSSGGGSAGARSGGQGGQETTTGRSGGGGPAQKSGTGTGDATGSR